MGLSTDICKFDIWYHQHMIILLDWWCISFEAIVVQSDNHIIGWLGQFSFSVGLVSHLVFYNDWILGNYLCNILYKCRKFREGLSNLNILYSMTSQLRLVFGKTTVAPLFLMIIVFKTQLLLCSDWWLPILYIYKCDGKTKYVSSWETFRGLAFNV